MRALLTSGIKAILAVAALSTAAHWAMRVQREAAPAAPVASIPDPVATGSIEPRAAERTVAAINAPASAMPSSASSPPRAVAAPASGLDQSHLAALIAGATPPKAKVAKAATKTASAEKVPSAEKAVARR
jgi:crotonobetainyl-CoA:carnitine CoA-transferase CaiB-like acyl-CoA transferase